jgi:phage terminase large subunit GpA-like protein
MSGEKFSEKGIVPPGAIVCTLGLDCQNDGFFYLLAAWGRKHELWLPLTGRLVGDMRDEAVWKALAEIITTLWLDKEGNAYKPKISCLDIQGDFYPECLEFVRAHSYHGLRAIRGYAPHKGETSGRSFGILRNRYTDKSTSVTVHSIDVNAAKSMIASMLARKDPIQVHLPCAADGGVKGGWDIEAVAELTAEYRRQSSLRGYTVTTWHKRSGRPNHRLDCLVYSLAALAISRLKIDDCAPQRIEARFVGKPEAEKDSRQSQFGACQAVMADNIDQVRIHRLRSHDTYAYGAHQATKLPGSASGFGAADRR